MQGWDAQVEEEKITADRTYDFRKKIDRLYAYLRSCAVCTAALPPVDLLCPICWREIGFHINRGDRLRQPDYPFPVYSLMTWTPENETFVKPFIYGFKGGRTIAAATKLASLFLNERMLASTSVDPLSRATVVQAPSSRFDHSSLWAHALSLPLATNSLPALRDVTPVGFDSGKGQKNRRQGERANRRYELREHFAGFFGPALAEKSDPPTSVPSSLPSRRIVFADDVITSGATAMAAYMALGDPDQFEVWTLVARPRLAGF